ncbi:hypothetical protein CEP51_015073 [Fusarium floridanum]|uniref:Major facilitator superfamily (MFS) profile domain-containing protein n=1 Tax=Fusarium floridanum TaxID=1325733 RepID=A0A428PH00_9HYPO|nr:hypothetical protein CEP51_015073 [Fusarium floridanum]
MAAIQNHEFDQEKPHHEVFDRIEVERVDLRPVDSEAEKKLVRKIDLYLMTSLWVMYLFSYMDRSNIGNAKIAGMNDDLGLTDEEYSLAIVVFIIGYILGQVPSNMFLTRLRPSLYIPGMMIAWGTVVCLMSLIKTPAQLIGCRLLLGLMEASFVPAVVFLISTWYKKTEQAKRFMTFTSAAILAGAFGSIVAGAIIETLHNAHGITGWRWLFIVEGLATIGVAIIGPFILLDYPGTTKKFSVDERTLATRRLYEDGVVSSIEGEGEISHLEALKAALSNWRLWMLVAGYHCIISTLALSYFYPYIVSSLGYTSTQAQFMTSPIYFTAFAIAVPCCIMADRWPRRRVYFVTSAMFMGTVFCILMTTVMVDVPRYIFLCFLTACIWTANPIAESFASSSMASIKPEVRAVSLAFINSMANLAQIYGSYLMPSWDAPRHAIGFGTFAGLLFTGGCIYASAMVVLMRRPFVSIQTQSVS